MKRARVLFAGAILGAALIAAGCAATTNFVSSWKEPTFQKGTVKKVFVIGAARDLSVRRRFEDAFSLKLWELNIDAVQSYKWFPELDPAKIDKDATATKLREQGFTHVLVSRLVDKKTVQTYVPPTTVGMGVGPGYPGYYGGWYPYMSTVYTTSPGYVTTDQVYSIETNFYQVDKEAIAWSGLTETTVSSSTTGNIEKFVGTIVYKMRGMKLF
jgi:hypothetical protein